MFRQTGLTTNYSRPTGLCAFQKVISNNYAKVIVVYGGMADIEIKSNTPASLIKSVSSIVSSTGNGQVYQFEV